MIEVPTDAKTRDAYRAAHAARGKALTELFAWLRGH